MSERHLQIISDLRNKLNGVDENVKRMVGTEKAVEEAVGALETSLQDWTRVTARGLEHLGAAFEWGIAEIVYHLELQTEELRRIAQILQAPLETQAKELRQRAEFAYRNGWIDEALADFVQSEKKNYADFIVHQNIGNIYAFSKNDPAKAEGYYEKAAKYARPHSSYDAAYALLHLAWARWRQGKTQEAYEATWQALTQEPYLAPVLYEHAAHSALLSDAEESIAYLRKAILSERNYCVRALTDERFNNVRRHVDELLEQLGQEARERVSAAKTRCVGLLDNSLITEYGFELDLDDARCALREAMGAVQESGYLDLLEVEGWIDGLSSWLVDGAKSGVERRESQAEADLQSTQRDLFWLVPLGALAAFVVFAFLVIIGLIFQTPWEAEAPHREIHREDVQGLLWSSVGVVVGVPFLYCVVWVLSNLLRNAKIARESRRLEKVRRDKAELEALSSTYVAEANQAARR